MKKAALLLSAALLSFFAPAATPAQKSFITYAYISVNTVLCDADGESICALPATYFLTVAGESENGKYPVSYLDLTGYVSADDVEIVDYEPVTKFPQRTARVHNDGLSVNLRDKPNTTAGKILCTVPDAVTLLLYGEKSGSELFAGAGKAWQYVRYTDADGQIIRGYIYAPQLVCDAIVPNIIEKVVRPAESLTETPAAPNVSRMGNIAIAAAMCVPAGILMLVLFYRPDAERTPRHARKE